MAVNKYQSVEFLTSAHTLKQTPADSGAEVAFVGRSNAGKSSLLNALTGRRKLAKTSKTPGCTQLLNFFQIDETHRLVDLPGYGYAKVSQKMRAHWDRTLDAYLRQRECLQGIVVIMDARHPMQKFDKQMCEWAYQSDMPLHLVLTKADKLRHGEKVKLMREMKQTVQAWPGIAAQLFSSETKEGLPELCRILDEWLAL